MSHRLNAGRQGVSLRGIAQWLDEQGVPTRRRGKGWHSQVVKLIADRMIGEKGSGGTKAYHLTVPAPTVK